MPAETEEAATEIAEAEEAAAEEARPTAEEVSAWLSRTKPAAVIALLKDPEYRAAVTPALGGFRPDAKSFSLPLVRNRLARAATKDDTLAEKLRALSETDAKLPPSPVPSREKPAQSAPSPPAGPDPLPLLRAERDARRRERDAARLELAAAQSERDAATKAQGQAEAERDEAQRLARKQAERIARLERQAVKARQLEARLVKALNEDKVSPPPAPRRRGPGPEPPAPRPAASPWLLAVRHLLDKEKFETTLALAEDVLKTDGDDLDALEIALRVWEGRGETRSALIPARRLLARQVQLLDFAAASETLLTLLRLVPSPEQAETDVRMLLAALPAADTPAVASVQRMLSRLRGSVSYDWLTAYIAARTSLGPVLMPPPGALGPDDPLPLSFQIGREITARHLIEAIDRSHIALVDAARAALKSAEAETAGRVWAALEQAASDDSTRLSALRRVPRGAAVVDGSNVAWFDQESLVQGRPRLRHLLAMRRLLWTRGFFPVVLYADANLPYFIDDKPALRSMRDHQELTLVDAGTVADEVLLRVAKQLRAPLITNDKMEDWDPDGEVQKVRYSIFMSGEAHLLSEI